MPIITPSMEELPPGKKFPKTMGHEISATVVEVGINVIDLRPGDKVAVWPINPDYTCSSCVRGQVNACLNDRALGFGGMSAPCERENAES